VDEFVHIAPTFARRWLSFNECKAGILKLFGDIPFFKANRSYAEAGGNVFVATWSIAE